MSSIKFTMTSDPTQAVAGLGAVADAISTVKIAMTGIQSAMFGFMSLNSAIMMFQRIVGIIGKVGDAIDKLAGDDSAIDRATDKVNRLAKSFEALKNAEKIGAESNKTKRGFEDDIAAEQHKKERALIDKRTAEALRETADPKKRQKIILNSEMEKIRLDTDFVDDKYYRDTTRIKADLAEIEANRAKAAARREAAAQQSNEARTTLTNYAHDPSVLGAMGWHPRSGRLKEKIIEKLQKEVQDSEKLYTETTEYLDELEKRRAALEHELKVAKIEKDTAYIGAAEDKAKISMAREDAARQEQETFRKENKKESDKLLKENRRRQEIEERGKEAIDKITVDQPRAATSLGAIGGIMGSDVSGANAALIAAQRHAQEMEVQKEQLRALSKIAQNTEE